MLPMASQIASLSDEDELLVAAAGGTLDGLSTPTSDTDILIICRAPVLPNLQRLLRQQSRLDLEHQDLDWFAAIEARLLNHAVSATGGLSPFAMLDLRFLVRVHSGEALFAVGTLRDRLDALRDKLRHAAAELISTRFVSCFEDVAGFVLGCQDDLAPILAGELVQSACLLALLQNGLVDLSPKWAVARCLRGPDPALAAATRAGLAHLTVGHSNDPHGWGVGLLHAVNRIVASGVCLSRAWATASPGAVASAASGSTEIPWCLMGLVGQLACADVEQNRILFVSRHYITALAGGGVLPDATVFRLDCAI